MIVIPPCKDHDEYFRELAESTWALLLKKHNCEPLKAESKTLVVTACGQDEDGTRPTFKLHYRYSKEKLYCFVEETEPLVNPESN